jgi:hypothetical protein
MKYLFLFLSIILLLSLYSFNKPKKRCADLKIVKIHEPDWDHPNKRTVVEVEIINIGKITSKACDAKIYDLDITYKQALEWKLEKEYMELVEENIARAKEAEVDYDPYVEAYASIPPIEPGKKVTLTFFINDHWVYDSNCELQVELDVNNKNKECDEYNNSQYFLGWG